MVLLSDMQSLARDGGTIFCGPTKSIRIGTEDKLCKGLRKHRCEHFTLLNCLHLTRVLSIQIREVLLQVAQEPRLVRAKFKLLPLCQHSLKLLPTSQTRDLR